VSIDTPLYDLPAGYTHVYSGKVRDLYSTPDDRLLFVASDRISAYDWVLPTTIPDKGRILTQLSLWWFKQYLESRSICGLGLPPGLKDGSLLPKTIFTPATKAELGEHDVNVTFDEVMTIIGQEEAQELKRLSLDIYERASEKVRRRGLILADTKFEFGIGLSGKNVGKVVLADEVLTPDSSRYWPLATWAPGGPQPSYDKQYVRDWLTSPASGWDRHGNTPPPPLPDEVVEQTRAKYVEAYERVTGETFR